MADTILVVDDEPSLLASLRYALDRSGFDVRTAADGPTALALVRESRPDLVLLDVMLPDLDGFEVCRRLRAESSVPIVMLTARDDPVDRIVGLEVGADDYIVKPFSMRELIARIRAHLRRLAIVRGDLPASEPSTAAASDAAAEAIAVGPITIDLAARRVTLDGRPVTLRRREFDLLAFLGHNAGVVLSRRKLLANVWDDALDRDTRTVDVHIRRLRRHIERDPNMPEFLLTVRGTGYMLRRAGPAADVNRP